MDGSYPENAQGYGMSRFARAISNRAFWHQALTGIVLVLMGGRNLYASEPLSGTVQEVLSASDYTYVRVKSTRGEVWAAIERIPLEVGGTITVANPSLVREFESKSLGRTFHSIYFGRLGPDAHALHANRGTERKRTRALASKKANLTLKPGEQGERISTNLDHSEHSGHEESSGHERHSDGGSDHEGQDPGSDGGEHVSHADGGGASHSNHSSQGGAGHSDHSGGEAGSEHSNHSSNRSRHSGHSSGNDRAGHASHSERAAKHSGHSETNSTNTGEQTSRSTSEKMDCSGNPGDPECRLKEALVQCKLGAKQANLPEFGALDTLGADMRELCSRSDFTWDCKSFSQKVEGAKAECRAMANGRTKNQDIQIPSGSNDDSPAPAHAAHAM